MDSKKKLLIFVLFFIIAFIFFRLRVLLFYSDGEMPLLREATGLTIHHFHYGLLIILLASLMLIFWEINGFSVGLIGFGLGAVFDSFIPRLFSFNSVRMTEIAFYEYSFWWTILLFVNVILLSFVFYLWNKKL